MRIWTLIKLIAALAVLGAVAFTGALAYHIKVKPLGGIFEKLVPNPAEIVKPQTDTEVVEMLKAPETPAVEPGQLAFEKATELVAAGDLASAREKLTTIANIYPSSAAAPQARRILGEMNLDQLLSPDNKEGKQTHIVVRGDSFARIATKYNTSLDLILHLNGLLDLAGLQPGDDLLVMPLDFRLVVEPQKKVVSLWNGGKFVKDYPLERADIPPVAAQTTTVDQKSATLDGKRVAPGAKGYRQAEKAIHLAKLPFQIRPVPATPGDKDAAPARGLFLSPSDMEELNLLTRIGNEVEIRPSSH